MVMSLQVVQQQHSTDTYQAAFLMGELQLFAVLAERGEVFCVGKSGESRVFKVGRWDVVERCSERRSSEGDRAVSNLRRKTERFRISVHNTKTPQIFATSPPEIDLPLDTRQKGNKEERFRPIRYIDLI